MPSSSSFTYDTASDVRLTDIFSKALAWLRQNLLWVVLGTLIGAGISVFVNAEKPKLYTSALIGYGNNLDDVRLREVLQHLNLLRATGNYPELAQRLNISDSDAHKIQTIVGKPHHTLEPDIPTFPPREVQHYHYGIEATVTDPAVFPRLQQGIVTYVDNQPQVKKWMAEQRGSLERRIATDLEEIRYLEVTKRKMLESPSSMGVLDIGTVSRHIVDINDKLEENRLRLADLQHEIIVTRPMEINTHPSSPGMYRAGAFGAAVGFALTLGLLGLVGLFRLSRKA